LPRLETDSNAAGNAPEAAETGILRERVDTLYASLLLSSAVSLCIALILVLIHYRYDPGDSHWAWTSAMVLVLGARTLSAWAYRRERDKTSTASRWLLRYRLGAATTAALWGAAGLLFFPEGQPGVQGFTLLVLIGMAAGALSVNITDYVTYRLFVTLALLPPAANLITAPHGIQISTGVLMLLLAAFLIMSGRRNYNTMMDSIRLRYRNAELLQDLAREKQRVINEAETMMGTVLACAPIALWAIDTAGTIRFMDGNRTGEQSGLRLPEVGDNLLTAFADHSQITYETQRALSGETFVTEIDLHDRSYEVHYSPLRGNGDEPDGAIGVAIDISDRKRHEQELDKRAHYDELTGLPNRTLIMSQAEHAFEQARRKRSHVAIFFLDLDNFKAVNDTMGHRAGDALLRQTAERLQRVVRESDIPGRLGGDEFLVISENLKSPDDAEVIAHKITHAFQRPFLIDGREIYATTSVGVAVYPTDGDSAEQLLQSADTAMYQAKSQGKNIYRFFTGEMQQRAERHLAMETELRRAVERDELKVLYQPKINLATHRIEGAEALLRWQSPTLGSVSPEEFVSVAEVAGLMSTIGDWVMRTACESAARWQSLREGRFNIAVNVSPQQFRNTDLLANVTQALIATGLSPERLELEITESVLVQDAPETLQVFDALRELGVRLALDDFGTGYSSLSYLKSFPLQVLKIDKSFIQDLGSNADDDSLVDAIIAMAKSLKLHVVAEGVETAEQLAYLQARHVELVQGYYFSRPVDADELTALLLAESGDGTVGSAAGGC
jgi:diguanylate cyclase (GGDEF)-like protein